MIPRTLTDTAGAFLFFVMKIRKPLFFLLLLFITLSLSAQSGGVAVGSDGEAGKTLEESFERVSAKAMPEPSSPAEEADIVLPDITTYIDAPVAEQRIVFDADDIQSKHLSDLPSVLEEAGVQVLSYGTYGLEQKPSIRGFTDETVRVVIDGICMNNAQTGTFDFSTINLNSIEKIEIVRGGFTEGVEDEGAVGGVIYITTKKQSLGHNFSADTSVKSFANLKTSPLTLDTFTQKLGYDGQLSENSFFKASLSASYAQNRYLYTDYSGAIATQKNALVKDAAADLKFTRYFGDGNSFSAGENFYRGNKTCPGSETAFNPGDLKDINNTVTFSLFNPGISESLNLRSSFAWTKTHRTYSDNTGSSRHDLDDFKFSSSAEIYSIEKIRQTAGLSLGAVFLDSTNSGEHSQLNGVLKETTKIYLNDIFSLTIPLGIKFCGSNLAFTPKIGFAAKLSAVEIIADGYRMIQFPNMDDLYWQGAGYSGNPDLKPEKGWGADLAFNVRKGFLPFSIEFFTNWYEDKICWSGNTTKNEKSAFYFGFDWNAGVSFFDGLLELKTTGEYLYTRLMNKNEKSTYGKRIMWTPDLTGSASLRLNFSRADFSISAKYTGRRYKSNLNISYLEPYTLLDASCNLRLWEHTVPYLRAENMLNTSYQSIDGYSMPGLSITVGVRWK